MLNLLSLILFILSLFLVRSNKHYMKQALFVNPGCPKGISDINLSRANKILFTLALICAMGKSLRIGTFVTVSCQFAY